MSGGSSNLRIGVLGGIGPESTAVFYIKLIEKLQATGLIKNNTDFPQIIINSVPAPELVSNNDKEALSYYTKGLRELDSFGVDFIVMVCNTIHLFYELLRRRVNAPILNLKVVMQNELIKNGATKIAVLGTENTIKLGLYEFKGVTNLDIDKDDVISLNQAIVSFNNGNDKRCQVKICEEVAKKYYSKGAQLIILGCTEIAVMLGKTKLPSINSVDLLADAVVSLYKAVKPRKFERTHNI